MAQQLSEALDRRNCIIRRREVEPGQSGNPSGRPPGIRDKRSAMRDVLLPHAPDLLRKAVEMALAGDTAALRVCLDRLIPPAKAKDDPVALPAMGGSLADNARVIVEALAAGELTPDEAAAVLQSLASQVQIMKATEIEDRVTALERAAGNKGGCSFCSSALIPLRAPSV